MSLPPLPGRNNESIIKPVRLPGDRQLGPLAVMISTQVDLKTIQGQASLSKTAHSPLMSRVFVSDDSHVSVTGPMMGAPYAVALMETLVAWGARTLLFFGWCGAVSPEASIGDVIVPTGAIIDEGTSLHYGNTAGQRADTGAEAAAQIRRCLSDKGLSYREGLVWTTDAPFRETPDKVAAARDKGACVVEMETSALFTAGRHLGVSVGAVLVVSDDVSTLTWKPGFKDRRFKDARKAVCEGIAGLCRSQARSF